jgi:RNA polymerase sigma-70 factor, ECF subfamily
MASHDRRDKHDLMGNLSEADQFLLEEIRRGSSTGWRQLVERYQGRLLAFARRKLGACADAEDLVQEAFISFLHGLPQYRGDASLDTYLFLILRRKIAGWARGRRGNVGSLQDAFGDSDSGHSANEPMADEPTASWYVRRDEDREAHRHALSAALGEIIGDLRSRREFKDLQVVEMIFYSQMRNTDIAQAAGVRDNYVAVVKHRLLARLQERIEQQLKTAPQGAAFDLPDALLTELWQEQRPSCLKRSTIGAFLLGTLEPDWQDYAAFHLEKLECAFCRANLEDMQTAVQDVPAQKLRDRIFESTIGFLGDSQRSS